MSAVLYGFAAINAVFLIMGALLGWSYGQLLISAAAAIVCFLVAETS